jgi:glycosyltransferase involved in cell wall biosynthesis
MRIDYLSIDSVREGVGASQVLPYVQRLAAAGMDVVLVSFERVAPDPGLRAQLGEQGVTWRPLPFGPPGPRGGASRVARAARAVRRSPLLHARGDLAAAAALVAKPTHWVWDMRSFWREQRLELGMLRPGSLEERAFRTVEKRAATDADGVVVLAAAAVGVLADRHGADVAERCVVIPTCVDLDRFAYSPLPAGPVQFLLAGTLNTYYDVPTMVKLVLRAQTRSEAALRVLSPDASRWQAELSSVQAHVASAQPDQMPMHVAASTVGLSVCRPGLGVSLTAAMPTKIGEFLASGRPVIVSPGIGDLDSLLSEYACGVLVLSPAERDLDAALDQLQALLGDPQLASRCRQLARDHFDVDTGVQRLLGLYEKVTAPP